MLAFKMVFFYIFFCIKNHAKPWNYFQLNAKYFNEKRKLFSKIEINQLIPKKWHLNEELVTTKTQIDDFPCFIKPEWGQNSYGIERADNANDWQKIKSAVLQKKQSYIVQQAALKKYEIEIFYICKTSQTYSALTIVQVNNQQKKPH